jgi:hypothetical protein
MRMMNRSRLRWLATGWILAVVAHVIPVHAQEPRGYEAGIEALATFAQPSFAGGGVSLGIRPGSAIRIVFTATPGVLRSRIAARAELLAELMLTPAKRRGVGIYGLAGVAGQVGRRDAGRLVLGLGIEGAPAARGGWHLEAGLGGGVRIAAGWRWRWLRRNRTQMP